MSEVRAHYPIRNAFFNSGEERYFRTDSWKGTITGVSGKNIQNMTKIHTLKPNKLSLDRVKIEMKK